MFSVQDVGIAFLFCFLSFLFFWFLTKKIFQALIKKISEEGGKKKRDWQSEGKFVLFNFFRAQEDPKNLLLAIHRNIVLQTKLQEITVISNYILISVIL